ncbi:hypothetical protein KQI65_15040 [bacterium]|nr:hypothetical protein [bacterium]
MQRALYIVLFMLCFLPALLHAQDEGEPSTDSLHTPEALEIEASRVVDVEDSADTKSPMGAVLRSALVPGWGQFYNESYWKVPIVLGVSGFLIYGIISEHQNFVDYADQYDATVTEDNPSGDLRLKRYREFYRDNRDSYGWWLLVTYLLQLADAYVDASLFAFDVSPESSLTLLPRPGGVGVQLRF